MMRNPRQAKFRMARVDTISPLAMIGVMSNSPPGLYRHLRAWRKKIRLTQEQVANILGISNTVLSEKERGVRKFKPEEIEKLVEIYGEEAWVMLAFDPSDPRLPLFKQARAMMDKMTPSQVKAWVSVGDAIMGNEK